MMEKERKLLCFQCQVELIMGKVQFSYLGATFSNNMLKCPKCGQLYIPESIVKGKMAQVESALEGK